ncbi:MAG: ribosome small subunit-dependent GTPase A [Nitrospinota bacterium]|nr:ribosome small subunit-dependent GTPase A [Nitrospinota bacterium]
MTLPPNNPLASILPFDPEGRQVGRVIAHHGKVVRIVSTEGEVECKKPHRQEWVVGDLILFEKGRPRTLLPRASELARKSPGGGEDVLAANIDLMLIVTAVGELFKKPLIDRFLVAAAHAGVDSLIALNKTDLPGAENDIEALAEYSYHDFHVIALSAVSGLGMEKLAAALGGKLSVMVGQSGVGKTSILNRLIPDMNRKIGGLSRATGKGKHTTSMSLTVPLPDGGAVIDSPGIRQFAPTGLEPDDLARHFPGLENLVGGCKFRDCTHESEPVCAVKAAVEEGKLSGERYESYLRILESIRDGREQDWWRRPEK